MIKQMESPQVRDSGDRRDRGITEAGSNSPDRPQTVEIHVVQLIDTEVNISVNMRMCKFFYCFKRSRRFLEGCLMKNCTQ